MSTDQNASPAKIYKATACRFCGHQICVCAERPGDGKRDTERLDWLSSNAEIRLIGPDDKRLIYEPNYQNVTVRGAIDAAMQPTPAAPATPEPAEPTPRTDEQEEHASVIGDFIGPNGRKSPHRVVLANFARTLERELTFAIAQRDKSNRDVDRMIGELRTMREQLATANDCIAALKAEVAKLEEALEQARMSLRCFDDDGTTPTTWEALAEKKAQALASVTAQRDELQLVCFNWEQQAKQWEADRDAWRNDALKATAERDEAKTQLAQVIAAHDSQKATIHSLIAERAEALRQGDALRAERDALIKTNQAQFLCFAKCSSMLPPEVGTTLESLPLAIKALVADRDEARKRSLMWHDRRKSAEIERDQLRAELATTKKALASLAEDHSKCVPGETEMDELVQLRAECDKLRRDVDRLCIIVRATKLPVEAVVDILTAHRDERDTLPAELAKVQEERDKALAQVAKDDSDRAEMLVRMSELKGDRTALRTIVAKKDEALKDLYELVSAQRCSIPDRLYGRVTNAAAALALTPAALADEARQLREDAQRWRNFETKFAIPALARAKEVQG